MADSAYVRMARLYAGDIDTTAPLLTDLQYQDLLTAEGDVPKLAAAQALDIIASSEALVSKKIRTQDLSTDGPAVAASLRANAAELRRQATAEAEAADVDGVFFDVVDHGSTSRPEHTAGL